MKTFIPDHRILITFLVLIGFLGVARPTVSSLCTGIPVVLIGLGIRIWASGDIRKNDVLATKGAYALTRNPLYLGSFLMGLGFTLMAGRLWLILIFLPLFYWVYRSTIRQEETILQQRFGVDFERYRESVPRFFPRWPGIRDFRSGRVFDWRLVKRHREYRAWIGVTGVILLMVLKMNLMSS